MIDDIRKFFWKLADLIVAGEPLRPRRGPAIVCLDFDGVIHSYSSGWKGPREIPDPPVPGAIRWIREFVFTLDITRAGSASLWKGPRRYKLAIFSGKFGG